MARQPEACSHLHYMTSKSWLAAQLSGSQHHSSELLYHQLGANPQYWAKQVTVARRSVNTPIL